MATTQAKEDVIGHSDIRQAWSEVRYMLLFSGPIPTVNTLRMHVEEETHDRLTGASKEKRCLNFHQWD